MTPYPANYPIADRLWVPSSIEFNCASCNRQLSGMHVSHYTDQPDKYYCNSDCAIVGPMVDEIIEEERNADKHGNRPAGSNTTPCNGD